MRPRLISFEGSEGCGKTTQIGHLKERLEARGETVLLAREPGGTPLGETVRHLLKHAAEGQGMTHEAELLLFAASRAELVRKVIRPALDAGAWVLTDRFIDSTTVYQGVARGLGAEAVSAVNGVAAGGLLPGLTLLLDLPAATAARRAHLRAGPGGADRIEKEDSTFFTKVRDGYLALAAAEPERVKRINGVAVPGVVAEAIWKEVSGAFQF